MSSLGERIRQRRKDLRLSQADVAAACDISRNAVSLWESGDTAPTRKNIETLAGALQTTAAWLEHGVGAEPAQPLVRTEYAGPPGWVRDLPILGHGEAGEDGFFYDNGEVFGYVGRPPSLVGVPGAYAVIVNNDSMAPRYEHSEVVLVNPNLPVKPKDYVVIQTVDDRGLIKRLKRRTQKITYFEQLNPETDIEFETAEIKALHKIIGAILA